MSSVKWRKKLYIINKMQYITSITVPSIVNVVLMEYLFLTKNVSSGIGCPGFGDPMNCTGKGVSILLVLNRYCEMCGQGPNVFRRGPIHTIWIWDWIIISLEGDADLTRGETIYNTLQHSTGCLHWLHARPPDHHHRIFLLSSEGQKYTLSHDM